jgi:hypothetical protein
MTRARKVGLSMRLFLILGLVSPTSSCYRHAAHSKVVVAFSGKRSCTNCLHFCDLCTAGN